MWVSILTLKTMSMEVYFHIKDSCQENSSLIADSTLAKIVKINWCSLIMITSFVTGDKLNVPYSCQGALHNYIREVRPRSLRAVVRFVGFLSFFNLEFCQAVWKFVTKPSNDNKASVSEICLNYGGSHKYNNENFICLSNLLRILRTFLIMII